MAPALQQDELPESSPASPRPRAPRGIKFPPGTLQAFLLFLLAGPAYSTWHELGHATMARHLGAEATISWKRTWVRSPTDREYQELWRRSRNGPLSPAESARYRVLDRRSIAVSMAGPLADSLAGATGLLLLLALRSRKAPLGLCRAGAFLALAWVQWIFFAMDMGWSLLRGVKPIGDAVATASLLDLPAMPLVAVMSALGALAIAFAFWLLPAQARAGMFVGSIAGGLVSYLTWDHALGPLLLP